MSITNDPRLLLQYELIDENSAVNSAIDWELTTFRHPLDILRMTRIFLSDRVLWCSQAVAMDNEDRNVRPNSPNATSWSVEGAVALISNRKGWYPRYFMRLFDYVIHTFFSHLIQPYGDTGAGMTFGMFESVFRYETVMTVLDTTIQLLEVHHG